MQLVSEPAVVTAVDPTGGRDRLLTFLTRGQGGVRLFEKRLARPRSAPRFIEPLQGGELVFVRSREGAAGRLFSFVPQRVWPGIRSSLERTVQAIAFLELLNICLTEGEPQPEIFSLLVRCLDRLEEERRPGLVRIRVSLRLLALSGFEPSLSVCVGCRAAVPAGTAVRISAQRGGVVCRSCRPSGGQQTIQVTSGAQGFMVRSLRLSEEQARRLRVSVVVEQEVSRLLDAFVEAQTGIQPRGGRAIEKLGVR